MPELFGKKGPGVSTITLFQATNFIFDQAGLVIRQPGN